MSGDAAYGGPSSGGSNTAGVIYSDGIPLPTGRAMANGSKACLITALFVHVGGTDGARTVTLQLGSAVTGSFSVPKQTSDVGTGWRDCNDWLVQGGTARIQVNNAPSGPLYFGHGGSGTTYGPSGYSRAGTLGCAYHWVEAPTAPVMSSATYAGGQDVSTVFTAPSDDGGTGITGYTLQYDNNSSFTSPASVSVTDGTNMVNNLAPGTWYFRAAAKNAVTAAAGSTSVWSATKSVTVPSVPTAPRTPSATAAAGKITVAYTAPSSNGGASITGYFVEYDNNSGFTSPATATSTLSLSKDITGLAPGKWYARVRAMNSEGYSPWSATVDATVPSVPSTPSAPSVAAIPGQATASWSAPANGGSAITGYDLQYDTDSSFGSPTTLAVTSSPKVISGLLPGVYYFRVRAKNAVGASAYSASSPATRVGIGGKRFNGSSAVPFTTAKRMSSG